GAVPDYGDGGTGDYTAKRPWNGNCETITKVVVGEGVTEIGQRAFQLFTGLTSVELPSTLKTIDTYAFIGCGALPAVVVPEGVTEFGEQPFRNCEGIATLTLPSTLNIDVSTNIGKNCSFKTINAPTGSQALAWAKEYAGTKSDVVVNETNNPNLFDNEWLDADGSKYTWKYENGVLTIGMDENNSSDGTSTDGTINIAEEGFYNNGSPWKNYRNDITSIVIDGKITQLGREMFREFDSLESVTIPGHITDMQWGVFAGCDNLKTVVFEEGAKFTAGGTKTFADCKSLSSVTLSSTVTRIPQGAFSGCVALDEITVPAALTQIEAWAAYINKSAFYGVGSLTIKYYAGTESVKACRAFKAAVASDADFSLTLSPVYVITVSALQSTDNNATINNSSSTDITASVIVAYFNGASLASAAVSNVTIPANGSTTVPAAPSDAGYKRTVFVWNNMTDIEPIASQLSE
ncbi:MAG: leucine-rich repeat protein, partial [Clostridia bacterium]|nr:leucine-rich repeat protein [Clostridia bacterium]